MINVIGIDHIVLVVSDIKRTQQFYSQVFGKEFAMEDEASFMIEASKGKVFFALPYGEYPENDRFSENRIGLDHIAFGVNNKRELENVLENLNKLGVKTNGIEKDRFAGKECVCFRDPDNIQVEFYCYTIPSSLLRGHRYL